MTCGISSYRHISQSYTSSLPLQLDAISMQDITATRANWMKNAVMDTDAKTWAITGILGLLSVQLLVNMYRRFFWSKRKPKMPPGPQNWPLIGAIFSMESNLAHCFTKLARKFGPIFYFRLGSHSIVVVSSVTGVEEVLRTKDSQFADRPNTTIRRTSAKYLGFEAQNIALSSYNDTLKMLKKVCITEFFTTSKLATYEDVRRHEGASLVEDIARHIDNGGSNDARRLNVEIRESVAIMATNLICMLLFGKRYSDSSETDKFRDYPDLVKRYMYLTLKPNVVDFFPWLEWLDPQGLTVQFKEYQELCRNCYAQTLEEHRLVRKSVKNYQDNDFVDLLLTLHESGKLTEDAILGCLMAMVVGGTDTFTTSTEWALLELIKNPDTLVKLQKEIDEVVGIDRQVEESDFDSMPYLQAVIKETFRLHAPAPLLAPHFNKSASSLGGFYVPANTAVFVNMHAISRDALLWEDPELFSPERFLGSRHSDIINLTGSSYQVLPFGFGRRMCPASNLGLLLVQRALTTLVHAFDWSPPPGLGINDISTVEGKGLLSHPEVPLVLTAAPRLAPAVYRTHMLAKS